METKITLRPIAKEDQEWARMLRNNNRKFFFDTRVISPSKQQAWFQALSYHFFVIEYKGERAGTVGVRNVPGGHEVNNVLIDKKYRRKGLFKQALTILEKTYGTPLYVDIQTNNLGAIRAYKRLGFTPFAYRMEKK